LHAPLTAVFGQDFKASAQIYLSLTMVLRGKIERGLAYGLEALAHAEQLNHPHSICYVLPYLAGAYLSAGMAKDALPFAERAVALSSEHEFYQWLAGSLMIRGWARTDAGDVAGGLSDVRESIEALRATNTVVWMQFAQFILAKALYATGACENAEGLVDQVLSDLNKISGRWYGAEVHRLRGNLRLRAGKPAGEVEACYESAIAIARQQRARLWELRATNDLGDLWIKDGRASQLRTRLAPLFDGFSAPPSHPDLARARRLVAASSECP
jgi:predicted ATPase